MADVTHSLEKEALSIYIHIPFCVRKCFYCDFLSAPSSRQQQRAYVDALCHEIVLASPEYQKFQVVSVFVGGGTPSVLEAEWMEKILQTLRNSFCLTADCEITIEVNPGTVTRAKMEAYQKAGMNRLSIGLQSANDEELKALGRIHTYEEFVRTYQLAREVGIQNINVDVMSSIPLQTIASYEQTLQTVLSLSPAPEHISSYSLMIEEGTLFYEQTPPLPSEETDRQLYEMTDVILKKAGYHRYEISNYAKEGAECRHNKVYWTRGNYLGFGVGSASLVHEIRWKNSSEISDYVNLLQEKEGFTERSAGQVFSLLRKDVTVLSEEEQMEEFMFLGLRMMEGVWEQDFYRQFHKRFEDVYPGVIAKHQKLHLLEAEPCSGKIADQEAFLHVSLTPKGIDVSNQVFVDFML